MRRLADEKPTPEVESPDVLAARLLYEEVFAKFPDVEHAQVFDLMLYLLKERDKNKFAENIGGMVTAAADQIMQALTALDDKKKGRHEGLK